MMNARDELERLEALEALEKALWDGLMVLERIRRARDRRLEDRAAAAREFHADAAAYAAPARPAVRRPKGAGVLIAREIDPAAALERLEKYGGRSLKPGQVAGVLRVCSASSVQAMGRAGVLPRERHGHEWRFPAAGVRGYLEELRRNGAAQLELNGGAATTAAVQ